MRKSKKRKSGNTRGKSHDKKQVGTVIFSRKNQQWIQILIFLFAFLLYANTISHDYTQDDAIVIYDNMYTTQGIDGIPGLLTKDTFFGFFKVEGKSKLVSGGRYRPLTPIMFALEWELFGRTPWVGHLINVILYGILGMVIFHLLKEISISRSHKIVSWFFVIAGTLIYIAHPVHSEVIANIKGRDEILSMLGSALAFYWILKAQRLKSYKRSYLAGIVFFLALLSKENAIMVLAVIPLALHYFRKSSLSEIVKLLWPALLAAIIFIIIRTAVLGLDFGDAPKELMNNPFLKIENQQYVPFDLNEKSATILFTLGNYVRLLFFPHPLTHDYYPRHIDIMTFGNWLVWLSLIIYIGLLFIAYRFRKKHPILSMGILFYLITLFITSNIVFPIGTNMSERFLFMPSLGFAICLAYIAAMFYQKAVLKKLVLLILLITVGLYSIKTITRNPVWKNDFTLFTTDVKTSSNSAKLLNAAGGALSNEAIKPENANRKDAMLNQATEYLKKAIQIHPMYKNAYLILGNCYHHLGQYQEAVSYYKTALKLDPDFQDAIKNIGINYRELGRYYGQQFNDLQKATEALLKAYQYRPDEYETVRLLGIAYGRSGQHDKAVRYFKEAVDLRPDLAGGYMNLGNAYLNTGQDEKARSMFAKAAEIDPNVLNRN